MTRCHYCSDEAFFHSRLSGKEVCAYHATEEEYEMPRCINHPNRLGPGGRLGDPGSHEVNLCNACGLRHLYEPARED